MTPKLPNVWNNHAGISISENVIIPYKFRGMDIFASAYLNYAKGYWVMCDHSGHNKLAQNVVTEWWPLPVRETGLSPTLKLLDCTVALVRDSFQSMVLKPALYKREYDKWYIIKESYVTTFSTTVFEWYPLPELGTGIPMPEI